MPHPLQRKIDSLRRRLRLADAARGTCVAIAALLLAVAALGSIDFLLRIEDRGVRFIFSFAAIGALGWAAYRFLAKAFFVRLEEDDLARRVEMCFPALRNRLLDAVQFLRRAEDDPTAGSPALRRAVIQSVEADSRTADFNAVVDGRRPLRAVALLAAVCLSAVGLFIAAPSIARTAVARIVNPLDDRPWPGDSRLDPLAPREAAPPRIETISIRLVPPSYSGLPPEETQWGVRALRGSRIEISATADRPLRAASLCFENGEKTETPASVAADGLSFTVGVDGEAFVVERSGEYWFELTDRDGVKGVGDRWPVAAVPDAPPTIEMPQPAADLSATPTAAVPIRIAAGDDLAVARIGLAYEVDGSAAERLLTISEGNVRRMDYRWDLSPLELRPGMKVTFQATAADTLGQTGRSERRRLVVVSVDELLDRLAERVKLIASELGRALEMQRACRDRVEALRASVAESSPLRQTDVDLLQSVRHAQEEVERLLSEAGEGLPVHVRTLLAELENNRVDNPLLQRQMGSLLDELATLKRQRLSAAARALAAAVKSARLEMEGQGGDAQIAADLADAVENQNALIERLQLWLDRLTRSDESGGMVLLVGILLRDQWSNSERTKTIGRRTLARRVADLSEKDAAELAAAAAEQLALARRLENLSRRYREQMGETSRAVADMSAAAEYIEMNRIGLAVAAQKNIIEELREIIGRAADGQSESTAGKTTVEVEGDNDGKKAASEEINGRPGEKPGSASEELRPPEKTDPAITRSRMLRLWGELPPRDREAMVRSSIEQFPPEYELLIEEYFRRLAAERGEGRGERGEGGDYSD
ncbi:MAG: hypothetical protein JW959_05465 [Pirellulales bacterium]|nr:hypothetical protein [Pirellulales bacterium]